MSRLLRTVTVLATAAVLGLGSGCGGSQARESASPVSASVSTAVSTAVPLGAPAASLSTAVAPTPTPSPTPGSGRHTSRLPLRGRTVVIDPGHQLGNHNFPAKIDRPVPAGGFEKPCNTTGTATDAGYPEATFTWRVALRLRTKLERLGASVLLTRHSNSERRWGPCVDVRGRAGNALPGGGHADLKISLHGDGSYAGGAHGFDVIYPPSRAPWTADIAQSSRRLALATRAGLEAHGFLPATYVGDDGLDVRDDLATLNLADIPTVLVECGNMRDSADAAVMVSRAGQGRFAAAFAQAVQRFIS